MSTGSMGRRALIQSAAVIAAVVCIPSAAKAVSLGAVPKLNSVGSHFGRTLTRFRDALDDPVAWISPGAAQIAAGVHLEGTTLTWRWDARLAAIATDEVVASTAKSGTTLKGTVAFADNAASLTVDLASVAALMTSDDCIFLPDLVDAPTLTSAVGAIEETKVFLTTADGRILDLASESLAAPAPPSSVWAAALSVLWFGGADPTNVSGHSYPGQILITSDGPDPVPAGTSVRMTADTAAVSEFDLLSAELIPGQVHPVVTTAAVAGTTHRLTVTLSAPIPAGSALTLLTKATVVEGYVASSATRSQTTVAIARAESDTALQRDTGSSSVSLAV